MSYRPFCSLQATPQALTAGYEKVKSLNWHFESIPPFNLILSVIVTLILKSVYFCFTSIQLAP